ncbi:hypothetical protein I3760_02G130800 [Carya illinoinensis]|nr:hypothetical protein I3760_02G130800 [Carya illinoinensis]
MTWPNHYSIANITTVWGRTKTSSSSSSSSSPCSTRSMAISCSYSSNIPVLKSGLVTKPISKSLMLKDSQVPPRKASRFQIRCSIRNKVFEDQSNGIVCYRDDSGEIICEGYDEGPRFQKQTPTTAYHPRLQTVKGSGLSHAEESVAVQKDFNCNGFNSFC